MGSRVRDVARCSHMNVPMIVRQAPGRRAVLSAPTHVALARNPTDPPRVPSAADREPGPSWTVPGVRQGLAQDCARTEPTPAGPRQHRFDRFGRSFEACVPKRLPTDVSTGSNDLSRSVPPVGSHGVTSVAGPTRGAGSRDSGESVTASPRGAVRRTGMRAQDRACHSRPCVSVPSARRPVGACGTAADDSPVHTGPAASGATTRWSRRRWAHGEAAARCLRRSHRSRGAARGSIAVSASHVPSAHPARRRAWRPCSGGP